MKQHIILIKYTILAIIFSLNLYSQDENLDKLPYDDSPPGVEEDEYFALGAGYGLAFKFANIDQINKLTLNYGLEAIQTPIVLNGGMMFYSLPWAGTRVSLWSLSGVSEAKNDTSFASLSSSQFGFGLEYGYVIVKTLALVGGVNASFTNIEFNLSQSSSETINWGDESIFSKLLKVQQNSYQLSPNLGLEWAITDFFMFRLNGAYNFTIWNEGWTLNNLETNASIFNNVNNDGLVISAGLFIGLFNY